MNKKSVAVVGAGFSGLTTAWILAKQNFHVEIFESADRTGGMIGTKNEDVMVEQAANAMLANRNIENLLQEIGVTAVKAGYRSNKRWIFRDKPLTMPLSFMELLKGLSQLLFSFVTNKIKPYAQEPLSQWAERVLSREFSTYIVSPAFQGIYGTSADRLSATLVLGSIFKKSLKPPKGELRGSISASGGMQDIINGLARALKAKGVVIHQNRPADINELQGKFSGIVIATSIKAAAQILNPVAPKTSEKLAGIPLLPLASVTLKFANTHRVQGFGCLFPAPEKFNALGVLFPSDIFPNRGENTETWITTDVESSDEKLLQILTEDHRRLAGHSEKPERFYIRRWPSALPLYGSKLETLLGEREFSEGLLQGVRVAECAKPVYLTGNYLGVIGLAKIFEYNIRLGQRIEKELS